MLLDPDVGDFWALLYNFEVSAKPTTADGVDDRDKRVAEVVRQAVAAQVTRLNPSALAHGLSLQFM